MDYWNDTNTDSCPACDTKLSGLNAKGHITEDERCSVCNVALKIISIDVLDPKEAFYTTQEIVIDRSR